MLLSFRKIRLRHHRLMVRDSSIHTQLVKLFIVLVVILLVHTIAMIEFEGLSVDDAVWLTMTSATTVGYGDLSAQTLFGRLATIILLYIGGIAILAQVAGLYFEHRQEVRNRIIRGDWRWCMENHIVFLNCPDEVGEEYFYRAIFTLRSSSAAVARLPIIIVCENMKDGLPDRLRKLDVVHVSKSLAENDSLESANVQKAHTVIILSKNQFDPMSDSINFELVDRLREMGFTGRIITEAVQDENRTRFKKIGANNVLRPIRMYPELLMRAIIAPGSEQVIETLFDSYGEECIRYEVAVKATWLEVIQKLTTADFGLPIAYENTDGLIFNNPSTKEKVDAKAIFMIVNEGHVRSNEEIIDVLRD